MSFKRRTYSERMQQLVEEYRKSGEPWPATRRVIARWMIKKGKWAGGEETLVNVCARDISRAMREEYHTDQQGRRVRTKHAAKFPAPGTEEGQQTLWGDIRTEPREFMARAFQGRRAQIVGDCVQLNTDVKSYNENRSRDNPIPMLFDFTDDVIESEQTGVMEASASVATASTKRKEERVPKSEIPTPSFPPSDVPVTPLVAAS